MSASSKKKLRKEQEAAKLTEQQLTAQKEAKKLNLYTTIFVVVLALLLIVAVVVGVNQTIANSGVRENKTVAMTVNSHDISNAELNYFYMDAVNTFLQQYGSYAAMFGLDTSVPLDKQVVDPDTGRTWADDFMSSAKDNAKAVYALADAAEAAGFALSEEDEATLEKNMENMELYAKLYGHKDGEAYLKALYGRGASKEGFLAFTKLNALANAFYADYALGLTYTDADLRAVDSEDFEAFSSYTYNTYYLSANSFLAEGAEGTDEEKAAALAAAEEAAKALTGEEIDSVEALNAAISALEINKDKTVSSAENKNVLGSKVSDLYGSWLKDKSRQAGDVAYFANTATVDEVETVNGYYVVCFVSSTDNTMNLINVRHILLPYEGGTKDENTGATVYTDEEKAAAKAAAEEVLAQWQDGDATEESFAALANKRSSDGNGTTGGLYENVYPGQMVEAFNDWCFDGSRKVGDTGIVETEYGYHVMYFSGISDYTYRNFMIENQLRSADAQEWYTKTVESASVTEGTTQYIRTDLVLKSN